MVCSYRAAFLETRNRSCEIGTGGVSFLQTWAQCNLLLWYALPFGELDPDIHVMQGVDVLGPVMALILTGDLEFISCELDRTELHLHFALGGASSD